MVINKTIMKRKRKEDRSSRLLDDSPKRTKVHAQRKFAQGSNVSSPAITPVKEIEKQEIDILPEPVELLPIKRPNTEDFLTFLCFRGTPILPPTLNFFNTASIVDTNGQVHEIKSESPKNGPIDTTAIAKACSTERPFIAFGVRKRADPIVISRQMDKKRRHALALQTLRRKYQEQKMAKIRAVTISKLSEKVTSRSSTIARLERETITKKSNPIPKSKIVEVNNVKRKIAPTPPPAPVPAAKTPIKAQIRPKMCLRSFRGRFVQKELQFRNVKKRLLPVKKPDKLDSSKKGLVKKDDKEEVDEEEDEDVVEEEEEDVEDESESEYSEEEEDDGKKKAETVLPKIAKKSAPGPKKPAEVSSRITRSNKFLANKVFTRRQQLKQQLLSTPKTAVKPRTLRSHSQKLPSSPEMKTRLMHMKIQNDKQKSKDSVVKKLVKKIDSIKHEPVKKPIPKSETVKKYVNQSPAKYKLIEVTKTELTKYKMVTKTTPDAKSDVLNKPKTLTLVKKPTPKTETAKILAKKDESPKKDDPEAEGNKNQRPSRKTKEAAAIYMELLSQKLVNESKIDDDNVSIDSFPELPNVKRTEQRENELKARAKSDPKSKNTDSDTETKKSSKTDRRRMGESSPEKEKSTTKPAKEEKPSLEKEKRALAKKPEIEPTKRQTRNSLLNIRHLEELSDDSDESFHADVRVPRKRQITRSKVTKEDESVKKPEVKKSARTKPTSYVECVSSESDESTTSDVEIKPVSKSKKVSKIKIPEKNNQSFSDSDEEPLSKLTQPKTVVQAKEPPPIKEKTEEMKPKRECAKRPQNYLPMFSSSDEDCVFVPNEIVQKDKIVAVKPVEECTHLQPSLDLKDIGRRFGKGKVNMSNEQIEKWLNDSAMAGNSVKSENDEMLKFGEKIPTETSFSIANLIDTEKLKTLLVKTPEKGETLTIETEKKSFEEAISPKSDDSKIKALSLDKKVIFCRKKDKIVLAPNAKAFSASNESSVYAFGEDDDVMKAPFRRPNRRPSSTATSRSEDELFKFEDCAKVGGPFRVPITKQDVVKSSKDDLVEEMRVESPKIVKTSPVMVQKPIIQYSMIPPANVAQKCNKLLKINKSFDRNSENSEEFKYKIPSSPSASSSSSANLCKKQKVKSAEVNPVHLTDFPIAGNAHLVEAPVFHPTEKEFQDPLEYIEKIRPRAEQFGICRIVPPSTFKPECKVTDDMRFTAYNQYVHKMLHRWGPNFKELMAIKTHLATQNISFPHSPWIGGMEVDLPRLYQTVQSLGGLKEVIEKKKWPKVSDVMKIPKSAQDRVTKLDDIYCKYLLPYDTLSLAEREKLFDEVETEWAKRESKSLTKLEESPENDAAATPDDASDSSSDDESSECIVRGRSMALNAFYRIARNTMSTWFKTSEPNATEVEQEYWRHVTLKQNHICVHSGSIDSGNWGYGFAVSKNSPFARHAWNLKVLTNNSGSVLRSLGPAMGVTVPTLHVGMVFSSCCWYMDPHGLPWIEYLHTGGNKIWYGIPNAMSRSFRAALHKIAPNYCQNKALWLPSDTVMVPPNLLVENGVSLSRTVQEPGQFVVVFPRVFTSNLSTGYVVSESVYFAPANWLESARELFDELRNSCEPSMFSLDRLLISIINDGRSSVEVLRQIIPAVRRLCDKEKTGRMMVRNLGVCRVEKLPLPGAKKKRKLQEEEGDYECDVCRMNLFLSMVSESEDDGVYCLDHAMDEINKKAIEAKNCKLSYTYDDEEIEGMVEKINQAISGKLQKKVNKYAGMPTLLTK